MIQRIILQFQVVVRKCRKTRPVTRILCTTLLLMQMMVILLYQHESLLPSGAPGRLETIKITPEQQNTGDNSDNSIANAPQNDDNVDRTSYKHLIDLFDLEKFSQEPMLHKCSTYFDELYAYDPNWEIGDLEDMEYLLPLAKDRAKYERVLFMLRKRGQRGLTRDQRLALKHQTTKDVDLMVQNNMEIENQIFNSIGHLKIFGKCFLEDKVKLRRPYKDLERKLFPWLTQKLPIYKRYDGTVVGNNQMPKLKKGPESLPEALPTFSTVTYHESMPFVNFLHENMAGNGILISVSDLHANNTVRLIHVLRYLDNEMPIQLVHRGDLSQEWQNKLVSLLRNELPVQQEHLLYESSYRKQDLWFVDCSNCISAEYIELEKFEMYLNKWITMLFTTFDNVVFLDDDLVPFVKPSQFFQFRKFLQTGTLFYKDRYLEHKMEDVFHNLYLRLLPSSTDYKLFGIRTVDKTIKAERFFKLRSRHLMESGLVVMQRSSHFTGLLVSTHLQMWTPTLTPVHGDKELFWLGQVISGSRILFNEIPAGASGWLDSFEMANHLCSIQPSHIHDEDEHSLLWVNSGLRYCKYNTWEQDLELKFYKEEANITSTEELRSLYTGPFLINSVIVPPDNMDTNFQGWKKRNGMGCGQYFFCAYDKVGSKKDKDATKIGKLVRYKKDEIERYGDLLRVWSYYDEEDM